MERFEAADSLNRRPLYFVVRVLTPPNWMTVVATHLIRLKLRGNLAVLNSTSKTQLPHLGAYTEMFIRLTQCAKHLLSPLSSAANQLFRRITQPAHSNVVTGTLADLPRCRAELLAENAGCASN